MTEALYCPIKNSECSLKPEVLPKPLCFIAIPFRKELKDTRKTVATVLEKHGIVPYLADEDVTAGRDILCKICEKITFSDFGVIELTSINPNVMLEFGLVLGRRKPFFILYNKGKESTQKYSIPADIIALERIEYFDQETLRNKFVKGITQYKERLNRKKRQVQSMIQISREAAEDKDFSTTDKLLDIIFERLDIEKSSNGDFVKLLEDIVTAADDPARELRYSLALARAYAFQKKFKRSVSCAKDAAYRYSILLKDVCAKSETIVDKEIIKLVLKNKRALFKDPFRLLINQYKRPGITIGDIFACIYHLIGELNRSHSKPEKLLVFIEKSIKEELSEEEQRFLPLSLRGRLWEPNIFGFYYISFLIAFTEIYPNKTSKEMETAMKTMNLVDNILDKFYKSIVAI